MTGVAFDPTAILAVLAKRGVDYVIVGGFAAVSLGSPLLTSDIDIAPDPVLENLARLSNALDDLDARIRTEAVPAGIPFGHTARSISTISFAPRKPRGDRRTGMLYLHSVPCASG